MRAERSLLITTLLLLQMLPAVAQYRREYPLPAPSIPGSLGVNIHFNDPRPGEMEQLAAAGFRWIRQDFSWSGIERTRGQYDFAPYERLMARLKAYHIRPIFILDYGNDLYEKGPPRSEEARAAFASFAAAAVTHFKHQGILWEMWNEPNGTGFWPPRADVKEYIPLALATGKAIREAVPDEWFIGPGVSGMDFDFMEKCFQGGLLETWDAVSFHPYRNNAPETATADFQRVRSMIERYKPHDRQIPILNSEWGYSELYPGLSLEKQSRWIVRQALNNVADGLTVSIWYDWHDDGTDPKEIEHHFGTVYHDYRPKPTYQAMATLTQTLRGTQFNKRLTLAADTDFCLLFTAGKQARLAVWTTEPRPHTVRIPASAGSFEIIDYLGKKSDAMADKSGLSVTLTDAPHYLLARDENSMLSLAAHWQVPSRIFVSSPEEATSALTRVTEGTWTDQDRANVAGLQIRALLGKAKAIVAATDILGKPVGSALPLDAFIREAAIPYHSTTPFPLMVTLRMTSGQELSQRLLLVARHPLEVVPQPAVRDRIPVRVENPTGFAFSGRVRLTHGSLESSVPLSFQEGQMEQTVSLPVKPETDGGYRAGFQIERKFPNSASWIPVSSSPEIEYKPLDDFARYPVNAAPPATDYRVLPDGDPKVSSRISMRVVDAPPGLPNSASRVLRIDYDFAPGWKFLRLEPENAKRAPLTGAPYALGAWVYGDGSGDILNARFTDATGQTFQPTAGRMDWKGWRFVSFSLRGDNSGHWSGADDGVVHYPIHLDTLLLVDSPGGRGGKGTLCATNLILMNTASP